MLIQILWAMLCAVGTVLLHSIYTLRLMKLLHKHSHAHFFEQRIGVRRFSILLEAVLILLLLHTVEAALWGVFYHQHPMGLPDFATAWYFSLTSYTTIGYGDVVLSPQLRLVGAMEGVVGTLMFGWSVALLASILQKSTTFSGSKPRNEDAVTAEKN